MITEKDIRYTLMECCGEVYFSFDGKLSGIETMVENAIQTYQAWHGDAVKYYTSIDDALNDKFYSGKSVLDLVGEIVIGLC